MSAGDYMGLFLIVCIIALILTSLVRAAK